MRYFIYYQAQDVMTPDPITVNPGDTLAKVEQIFEEHDFNGVPVVDEKKRLLGFITKLDLLKVSCPVNYNRPLLYPAVMRESVSNVMTKAPTAVWSDTPLTTVLGVIVEKEYKSLPVVENHIVVGIIAREDILETFAYIQPDDGNIYDQTLFRLGLPRPQLNHLFTNL